MLSFLAKTYKKTVSCIFILKTSSEDGTWVWKHNGTEYELNTGDDVFFKTTAINFNSRPETYIEMILKKTATEDTAEGVAVTFMILGRMNEPGLGNKSWWF